MNQAIDPNATEIVYLKSDAEQNYPYTIGVVDCLLMAAISDMFTTYAQNKNGLDSAADVKLHIAKKAIETVRYGLKAWNLMDKNGDIKLETEMHNVPGIGPREGLKNDSMKRLSLSTVREISAKIYVFSTLTEDQEKN